MSWTRLTSAKKHGFGKSALHSRKDPPRITLLYMKQKSSFLIAALSIVAFMTGNMMGQHGWYTFWKAALGQYDDSLITYTGTVPPIAFVPDYRRWSTYGGMAEEHMYREVPSDLLLPIPAYIGDTSSVYSVAYMGSYSSGTQNSGSHPGVDIRVPQGTPIRSIANGVVESVREDSGGFGKLIVIRHPHMPDPVNADYETVLHSVYAHLSAELVAEGDVVMKGQLIGYSGKTGDATGPHLHFQIDRDTAPWHPYWPFNGADLKAAGLSTLQAINGKFHQDIGIKYTVNPMVLVQADLPPAKYQEDASKFAKKPTPVVTLALSPAELRTKRLTGRVARLHDAQAALPVLVVNRETVVSVADRPAVPAPVPTPTTSQKLGSIAFVTLQHGTQFDDRSWQAARLTFMDDTGTMLTDTRALPASMMLRTAYGDAEFQPSIITPAMIKEGLVTVQMLPHGRRTIVLQLEPLHLTSNPLKFFGN